MLIAEPGELGEALKWMLGTARGSAPTSVAELAARLGISQAQVYKYLKGETVPPDEKWEKILDGFGFTGPERGSWASAGERVRERERVRREQHRHNRSDQDGRGDHPPTRSNDRPRRRWLQLVAVGLCLALVGGFAAYRYFTGGDDKVMDVQCPGLGSGASWQNHHSRRYLSLTERPGEPSMIDAGQPLPTVVTGPREGLAEGNCATAFTMPRGQSAARQCLTAVTSPFWRRPAVKLADCDDTDAQLWVLERHWPYENVMWHRIRPAASLDSCLQEQPRGDGTTRVTLQPCGSDWQQQWKVGLVTASE